MIFNVEGSLYDSGGDSGSYSNNEKWNQLIVCPATSIVYMTIPSFGLDLSPDCTRDRLTLYDGPDEGSTVILRACTFTWLPSAVFISTANQALISLTTDGSITGTGYNIKYWCAQAYGGMTGEVYDSGGPSGDYANNEVLYQMIRCSVGYYPYAVIEMNVDPSSVDRLEVNSLRTAVTGGLTPTILNEKRFGQYEGEM